MSFHFSQLMPPIDGRFYCSPQNHRSDERHNLWKGIVTEIRSLPPHIYKEGLISIQWFWSKEDIEKEFCNRRIKIPESMRR
jgi:hypothetical protein